MTGHDDLTLMQLLRSANRMNIEQANVPPTDLETVLNDEIKCVSSMCLFIRYVQKTDTGIENGISVGILSDYMLVDTD